MHINRVCVKCMCACVCVESVCAVIILNSEMPNGTNGTLHMPHTLWPHHNHKNLYRQNEKPKWWPSV